MISTTFHNENIPFFLFSRPIGSNKNSKYIFLFLNLFLQKKGKVWNLEIYKQLTGLQKIRNK